jgi:hypothetical protein
MTNEELMTLIEEIARVALEDQKCVLGTSSMSLMRQQRI